MIEKIRAMKNKKGFTLVELIVVLVILGILAALLVPALTGYIDRANKEKVKSECRMVVMAAQTEASEKYSTLDTTDTDKATTLAGKMVADSIKTLSETKGKFTVYVDKDGKVQQVDYYNSGFKCVYKASDSTYTVTSGNLEDDSTVTAYSAS